MTSGTRWEGKNVLITGISGFIGTALARHLLELGANVHGIVKEWGHVPWPVLDDAVLIQADICDKDAIREAISFYEIDVVFHFAAFAIVRVAARDPVSTYRVNVMGTVNLLEACRSVGKCEAIVVASSDKAYGDHSVLPYTESFALQPNNTYDTSKACMDMVARSYAKNYNMPICVTRCSNVYGPGDMNLSRIVPNTIKRSLSGKPPLVYSDVQSMEREFIYISDVVDAYVRLAEEMAERPLVFSGYAFNIGGTGPTSIYDLVEKLGKIAGIEESPIVKDRDSIFKEIKKQYIDAGRLERATGWKPRVKLDEGLRLTYDWYKEYYEKGDYL